MKIDLLFSIHYNFDDLISFIEQFTKVNDIKSN